MGYRRKISNTGKPKKYLEPAIVYVLKAIHGDRWYALPDAVLMQEVERLRKEAK